MCPNMCMRDNLLKQTEAKLFEVKRLEISAEQLFILAIILLLIYLTLNR